MTAQRAELQQAGCLRIFAEQITGTRRDRPELERLLDYLRVGDVVVVTQLDRLARSARDLLDIAERLSLSEAGLPWDASVRHRQPLESRSRSKTMWGGVKSWLPLPFYPRHSKHLRYPFIGLQRGFVAHEVSLDF